MTNTRITLMCHIYANTVSTGAPQNA